MRILIIGSGGMLGRDLVRLWTEDEIIPATSRDADIGDIRQALQLVTQARPDWIVLTATYTDVDGSEQNSELAFAVNGEGTKNVACVAQERGAKLFFGSTDYLFDGTATHPVEPGHPIAPPNVYGQSKVAGEKAIQENHSAWWVARTSWLFDTSGTCFPEKILRASESRQKSTVVADQFGSPTDTRDLVRADGRGVLHVTNVGSCSWSALRAKYSGKWGGARFASCPSLLSKPSAQPVRFFHR